VTSLERHPRAATAEPAEQPELRRAAFERQLRTAEAIVLGTLFVLGVLTLLAKGRRPPSEWHSFDRGAFFCTFRSECRLRPCRARWIFALR